MSLGCQRTTGEDQTICVMSDSFNDTGNAEALTASGDLPHVEVVKVSCRGTHLRVKIRQYESLLVLGLRIGSCIFIYPIPCPKTDFVARDGKGNLKRQSESAELRPYTDTPVILPLGWLDTFAS